MRTACGLIVALASVAIVSCQGLAQGEESKPELAITLEQPKSDFVLGQPIPLTAVFHNNLNRDVRIIGFRPESALPLQGFCILHMDFARKPSRTIRRTETRTTRIRIIRLSGESSGDRNSFQTDRDDGRSFVVKAGASVEQQFDLMQTTGTLMIESPGRFRIDLFYKQEIEADKDFDRDTLDWEGEACARPIEITVVSKKN